MKVKDYIIKNGIKALQGCEIKVNDKIYKIQLDDNDLVYHSLECDSWKGNKSRLNQYHEKGNYRFYAQEEKGMCIWVYPSTEIYAQETVRTKYGEIKLIKENGATKIDFNNSRFNTLKEFSKFLDDTDLLHKIVGY